MKPYTIIDIGSSTIKLHDYDPQLRLTSKRSKTINLAENFYPERLISPERQNEFIAFLNQELSNPKERTIYAIATGVVRKADNQHEFLQNVKTETGIDIRIVTGNEEAELLFAGVSADFPIGKRFLAINIGGGSTEVIFGGKDNIDERYSVDIGVSELNEKFVTEYPVNGTNIATMITHIQVRVSSLKSPYPVEFMIHTGGELTYVKVATYDLHPFDQSKSHPYQIRLDDFMRRTKELALFSRQDLHSMMPENPSWMNGAIACSTLASVIAQQFRINTVIPSDINLVDGIVEELKRKQKKVTISGSFRKHLSDIQHVIKIFEQKGYEILSPKYTSPKNPGEEFVLFQGETTENPKLLEYDHLEAIRDSDFLFLVDPEGYVGNSATMEVGYAHAKGKPIYAMEKPTEFMIQQFVSRVTRPEDL